MSFDVQFIRMMETVITIAPYIGQSDIYGSRGTGTAWMTPAHVTYRTGSVRTSSQDYVVYRAELQIPPPGYQALVNGAYYAVLQVNEEDLVTLPDGVQRHVLLAECYTDGAGFHSQSLLLS